MGSNQESDYVVPGPTSATTEVIITPEVHAKIEASVDGLIAGIVPKPGPHPISITCSVRRVIQPKQYESAEFVMAATCEVDPGMTLGENLSKVHKLLVSKVDWAVEIWVGTHPEGR